MHIFAKVQISGKCDLIFATKYQKAGEWRLILSVGVIEPGATFILLFKGVTLTG